MNSRWRATPEVRSVEDLPAKESLRGEELAEGAHLVARYVELSEAVRARVGPGRARAAHEPARGRADRRDGAVIGLDAVARIGGERMLF